MIDFRLSLLITRGLLRKNPKGKSLLWYPQWNGRAHGRHLEWHVMSCCTHDSTHDKPGARHCLQLYIHVPGSLIIDWS